MTAFIGELVKRQEEDVELEIECDPRNRGSRKLAERLGFEKISCVERAYESKGEWVGSLVYRKVVSRRDES
jgi:RimJ/RimL family protein N-acetyltransferase